MVLCFIYYVLGVLLGVASVVCRVSSSLRLCFSYVIQLCKIVFISFITFGVYIVFGDYILKVLVPLVKPF